ncbi:threonine ammonia-lyase, biosynthetic [Natronospirillum operosum]|uniref:L-threonine dehydratase n=1 Tax=Natronospirillum operosum TaxID=2759953 RepID=A0A4Z0W8D8_9GAMM|nr:threonine ammonia-lyase, biosynthetic [Natronospirillum operosum]TGG93209.1 threonine ammonia-lyase, biosynthetic [Natronospirillum operosum]
MTLEDYVKKILNSRVYEAARETPLEFAKNLSHRLDNEIWIKREDLQPVFSFKIRGAYNRMALLSDEERERGVICASAGNHAQGVAYAAHQLKTRAVIVMPKTTPDIKVQAVRSHGGKYVKVVLHGDAFDEASEHSRKLMDEQGLTYIHPYDDPDTIAGQGTIAREILHQHNQPLDAIFVCVGGGGLAAGIAAYIKYLRPEIKVIGVEFEESACLAAAMVAGKPVKLEQVGIFADGAAVAQVGAEAWKVCQHHIDEVITVTADEICAAVKDMFDDTRSIAEPAGALALAGMKKYVERDSTTGETYVAICSGANMNFDRLAFVSEQAELGEKREAILAVTIPERPGAFREFCSTVGKRPVTEFNYRYDDDQAANIFVGIKVEDAAEKEALIEALRQVDYKVLDLSENEIAKTHIRHMVGGKSHHAADEVLYRFEFPERPGALMNFLRTLGGRWNISLFHYRNHGDAYGRVLCAFQVPEAQRDEFGDKLEQVGYTYWAESDNPVYRMFL